MARTRDFLINTSFTGLHHLFVIISGFIIPKIMLVYYGSEIFGLVTSITQFISYFMVVEAGLATAGVVALYKPIVDSDYHKISGIVSATKELYYTTGHLFMLLVVGLSLIYPCFVSPTGFSYLDIVLLTICIGSSGALDFYTMSRFRVILTAFQKVYIIAIGNIIYVVFNILVTFLCAKFGASVILLKFIVLISVVARSLFLRVYVNHNYPLINHNQESLKHELRNRWDALYLQVLGAIHNGTPIVLITLLCTLTDVSVYAVFNIVIAGILGLLALFSTSLFPSFGDIIARGDKKLLQGSFEKFELLYYVLLAIITTSLILLLQNFVTLYTGDVSQKSDYVNPELGLLMIANMLFHNIKTPQGMLVLSAGLFKETRWQTTIQGLLAIVCGALLGYFFGMDGIIIGIILSNLYRDIDLMIFIPKRVTGLKWTGTLTRVIIMLLSIFLSVMILRLFISMSPTWQGWIINGVISVIVSLVVTLFLFNLFFHRILRSSLLQFKAILK